MDLLPAGSAAAAAARIWTGLLGTFATLISRLTHLPPGYEQALRALGEGPMTDLVHDLQGSGELERRTVMDVTEGLAYLWPRLHELTKTRPA